MLRNERRSTEDDTVKWLLRLHQLRSIRGVSRHPRRRPRRLVRASRASLQPRARGAYDSWKSS